MGSKTRCEEQRLLNLPNDLLEIIVDKTITDEETSFRNVSLVCKSLHDLAYTPRISKSLTLHNFENKLPSIDEGGKSFLAKLSLNGNKKARFLLATNLFFNDKKLHVFFLLKDCFDYANPQTIYNFGMALLSMKNYKGVHILQKLIDPSGDRSILSNCRDQFQRMVGNDTCSRLRRTRLCKLRGRTHWRPKKLFTIVGQKEHNVKCPFCGIDIETTKVWLPLPE